MAVKTFTVPGRGRGKKDYSREVSRSIERAGLRLGYNQSLKNFYAIFTDLASPFAWVKELLAAEATAHLVDAETDLDMPYTLPQGYTISLIQDSFGFTEESEVWVLSDTYPTAQLSVSAGGVEVYRNRVSPFTSQVLDPTGATAHLIDITVRNKGAAAMGGSFAVSAIVEAVGTQPLPTIKRVKCKHCGHQWDVPVTTTELICPECGKLTMVYDLSQFKGTI